MAESTNPKVWNPDKIFSMLADPVRRRVLMSLARGGPLTAAQLQGSGNRRVNAIVKQLTALREAGMAVQQENKADGRRYLYALDAAMPLVKTERGMALDFGFVCVWL